MRRVRFVGRMVRHAADRALRRAIGFRVGTLRDHLHAPFLKL